MRYSVDSDLFGGKVRSTYLTTGACLVVAFIGEQSILKIASICGASSSGALNRVKYLQIFGLHPVNSSQRLSLLGKGAKKSRDLHLGMGELKSSLDWFPLPSFYLFPTKESGFPMTYPLESYL